MAGMADIEVKYLGLRKLRACRTEEAQFQQQFQQQMQPQMQQQQQVQTTSEGPKKSFWMLIG